MKRNDAPIGVFFSILESEISDGRRAAGALLLAVQPLDVAVMESTRLAVQPFQHGA